MANVLDWYVNKYGALPPIHIHEAKKIELVAKYRKAALGYARKRSL